MADAPVDALLDRVDDLAKGWLLELVDQVPLAQAPSILAGELASSGPRLCAAVVRALAADSALAAIERGGPLAPMAAEAGRLAGAEALGDVSRAIDALMAVLWSAIRAELRDPDAELVSELAERLAHVIEAVREAALERFAGRGVEGREIAPGPVPVDGGAEPLPASGADPVRAPDPPRAPTAWPASPRRARVPEIPRVPDAPPASEPTPVADPGPAPTPPPREAAGPAPTPPPRENAGAARRETPAANGVTPPDQPVPKRHLDEMSADSRVRSWPGGLETPPRHKSLRSEALWVGAIDDEIDRAENSGSALSLLLVELEEADRVLAVEDPSEASMTFRRFAQAVRTVVRRQDILACESESRAWIIAPGTDRAAARALGARIEHAVRAEPPWRGAPMTISVGLSVLGEDGHESAALMDVADEARFAAMAEGVGVHASGPADPAPSPRGGPRRID